MLINKDTPKHVAFIMDGNGRWAKVRGLNRVAGHRKGIERVKEIIRCACELNIEIVTFFAFSHENWSRPKLEVSALMRYLDGFLKKEIKELHKNNMCFKVIGRADPIPKYLQKKIAESIQLTAKNTGLKVVLALNYGARQEIIDAAKRFAEDVRLGKIAAKDLDEEKFADYFYTAGLIDPDLLIRTSGEKRLSNFLLWQLSYAEFYFSDKLWPDFGRQELEEALKDFSCRQRRFGGVIDAN